MKTLNLFRPILACALGASLLTGFTGKENFVELGGHFNGRTSSSFISNSNVGGTLQAGTRGEILSYTKLPSGNYGLRIKVLNGPHKNSTFWVYHKNSDSDLALYEQPPQHWEQGSSRKSASIDEARGVETIRETRAHDEKQQGTAVVELMNDTNAKVQRAGTTNYCSDCDLKPHEGRNSILRPVGERAVAQACSALMDSRGNLGPDGQSLYSIMAEPQYLRHFTKQNALGDFCPRFDELSDSEKLQAWTWFWTALATEEASCDPKKIHKTTYRDRKGRIRILNPRLGYGLWALEKDRNVRRWRGSACNNISTVEGQARCSVDIMKKTQLTGGLSAAEGYWGPVRRGDSQMMPHMRRLKSCF